MFEFYTADVRGQQYNTVYPNRIEVVDESSLRRAVERDYVCATYKNNRRGNERFISSNCLAFDVDNDGSEDSRNWITPEDIIEKFPNVTMAFHFSRNHMVDKHYTDATTGEITKTVTARPRFHVFFEITPVHDYAEYKALKEKALDVFPCFDRAALDPARFFYGTEDPRVMFHQGTETLTGYLCPADFEDVLSRIKEGTRNKTLSVYAAKILKRYGVTEEVHRMFMEKNELCDPPLDDGELNTIWNSALKFYKKVVGSLDYVPPEKYGQLTATTEDSAWDEPLPLGDETPPAFPIDALPDALRNYAIAVGESTQTPVDMAAVSCLTTVSACMRNLFKVEGKADWHEPTNIYSVIIAEPSERKSAVISLATKPVDEYIKDYNEKHKMEIEMSRAQKQMLENRKNSLISQSRKKGEESSAMDFNDSLRRAVEELVNFQEIRPLRIYVDDITPEKLTETLAENGGATSIISSEGGIFDVLSGTYTNKVNIDVFLKAYSCENISVDRIMRQSMSVNEACLTILLSVQPIVIGDIMGNKKFRNRGLTARFLYSAPKSLVGLRSLDSKAVSPEAYLAYKTLIYNILAEERKGKAELIRLTPEARTVLEGYYEWAEKLLAGEFSM